MFLVAMSLVKMLFGARLREAICHTRPVLIVRNIHIKGNSQKPDYYALCFLNPRTRGRYSERDGT